MLIHKETQIELKEQCAELYSTLQKHCLSITNNRWDADDLTQEAFAKTLSFYASKREPNITIPLLRTIARNSWIDELRKKSKLQLGSIDECGYEDQSSEDLQEGLEQLMERLTPKQLLAFVMKEGFLYSLSEIADRLQIKETAVKALLYRARQKTQDHDGDFSHHWYNIRQDWFKSRLIQAVKYENSTVLEELIIAISEITIQNQVHRESRSSVKMMFQPLSRNQMAA
ncbi:sigma-70 family RNA polymerase sigma factor [Paenibacillus sp. IHBB 10380]|uniref:sigma-70 family RNA polymerase sigma factor n=1 Tax=Paenibacillus sp. IHBB 10380 TaxID=1566358 RepID=UPI00069606D3|nr:sigma-70 family RNA polymerase sigma factor [Paenibacillus sp. IHBB 10380]